MPRLSLRRLWTIYKRTAIRQGTGASKRELALTQLAFYSGARGVLTVLDRMIAERRLRGSAQDHPAPRTADQAHPRATPSSAAALTGGEKAICSWLVRPS